jgi:hypothetical protein
MCAISPDHFGSNERMKTAHFWVIALYSLVDIDRRFRGTYCRHHQGDEQMFIDIFMPLETILFS